jgi:hypothetical protein
LAGNEYNVVRVTVPVPPEELELPPEEELLDPLEVPDEEPLDDEPLDDELPLLDVEELEPPLEPDDDEPVPVPAAPPPPPPQADRNVLSRMPPINAALRRVRSA